MLKDWQQIAQGYGLDIPDVARLEPALDGLEAAFRPLVRAIPEAVEPAVTFHAGGEEA